MDLINTIVSDEESSSEEQSSDDGSVMGTGMAPLLAAEVTDDLAYIAATLGPLEEEETGSEAPAVAPTPPSAPPAAPRVECSDSDSSDSEGEGADLSDAAMEMDQEAAALEDMLAEEEEGVSVGPGEVPRTKNEVLAAELEQEAAGPLDALRSGDELTLIGVVHSHVPEDRCIVVRAFETNSALAEESVLCARASDGGSEQGRPQRERAARLLVCDSQDESLATGTVSVGGASALGAVHEVFGPLHTPFYIVRYRQLDPIDGEEEAAAAEDTAKRIAARVLQGLQLGASVYCLQRKASTIQEELLARMHAKGSDASNVFDEEATGSDVDYSDDEQEQAARARAKAARRAKRAPNDDPSAEEMLGGQTARPSRRRVRGARAQPAAGHQAGALGQPHVSLQPYLGQPGGQQGYAPHGYPPQQFAPQGQYQYPPQQYAPPQQYSPQQYYQQPYPPQQYPSQPYGPSGYPAGAPHPFLQASQQPQPPPPPPTGVTPRPPLPPNPPS